MNKRSLRKALIKERKQLKAKMRELDKRTSVLKEQTTRLLQVKDLRNSFNFEEAMTKTGLDVNDFLNSSVVWIVSKHEEEDTVIVTSFFDLLRNEETPKTVKLDGILKQRPFIGSDGKEVSLELGALVAIKHVKLNNQLQFHIANVFPSDERGRIQYHFLLNKLGLGMKQYVEHLTEVDFNTDGQFRQSVIEEITKRKNEKEN